MILTAVIPVFNEPRDRILATVLSAIDACENVIVVDDGSNTPVDLDGYGVIVRRQDNRGCPAALNAGIAGAGDDEWIIRLDCGDTLKLNKYKQAEQAIKHGMQASASSSYDIVNGKPLPVSPKWKSRIYTDNQFTASTTIFRKAVWYALGGYNESLRYCDDWEWAVRVQSRFGWDMFEEVTANVGCFPGGLTDQGRNDAARQGSDRATVARLARSLPK